MGVDLALFPDNYPHMVEHSGWMLGDTRIELTRQSALFDAIIAEVKRIGPHKTVAVRGYVGEEWGTAETDPYGDPIMRLSAGVLAGTFARIDCYPWNRAVGVLLAALPEATPIALFWH